MVGAMAKTIGLSLLLGASMIPASAQSRNASEIRGTVHDASGGVVPDVSVTGTNTATGQVVRGKTNKSGIYDFPYVPPGPYAITFVKDGYEEVTKTNLILTVDVVTVDADLRVGNTTAQVSVDASNSSLLQTETPEVGTTLTTEMLSALPNPTSKWSNLTSVLPGVAAVKINGSLSAMAGGSGNSGAYVGFNGGEANEINIMTNGAENFTIQAHDAEWQSQPLDAIADVTVATGTFGADGGNGTSVINLTIKSGTNHFHGSAWEIAENTFLNTKPWGATTKTATHWNKYGYSIGGPVLRNRLFFFQSQQWNHYTAAANGFYTVPENAVRGLGTTNGDSVFDPSIYGTIYDPATSQIVNGVRVRQPFPNNTIPAGRISPVAAAILKYYPLANQPYSNGSNYNWTGPAAPTDYYNWIYRVDYDVTASNRLSTTGSIERLPYWGPTVGTPDNFFGTGGKPYGYNTYQGTDAWSPSSAILNESRFSYYKVYRQYYCKDTGVTNTLGLSNVPYDIFPAVNFSGGARNPYGGNRCSPSGTTEYSYAVSDSVSWLKGKHTFRFGGEGNWMSSHSVQSQSSGSFSFNGNSTTNPNLNIATGISSPKGGSGLADFMLGSVDSWSNTNSIAPVITNWLLQYYAQDAYKIRPNLTVNVGLRAVYQTGLKETQGRFANFQPNLINPATGTLGAVAFGSVSLGHAMETNRWFYQPRAGFSWSPRTNWVVRGGFGLYAVPWASTTYSENVGTGYQGFGSLTQAAGNFDPVMSFTDPSPNLTYPTSADLKPSLLNGQSISYLPPNIPSQYQDEHMVGIQHLLGGYLIDVAYVGTTIHHKLFQTNYTQIPEDQLGSSKHPYSQYSGVTYMTRNGWGNYNSLQVQSRRQFKNGFTYQANYTYSKNLDTGSTSGLQSASGLDIYQSSYSPAANYGPALNDYRHMLNGGIVYRLPFGRDMQFLNRPGFVDSVVGGWQLASTFQWHAGTPITPTVGGEPFSASGLFSGNAWFANRVGSGKLSHRTLGRWYNVNDFAVPANNTLGNTGRNVIFGPRYSDIDMGLAKSFHIPRIETGSFQFRIDAQNVMNHHAWGEPSTAIYATPALNDTNDAGAISAHGAGRSLQLEGHLRF
jgi:Carboxypeptidase regulatory-like domain